MTKQRLDGKKKLVRLTGEMEADIKSFCRDKGVESESELIRQAVAKYIYADYQDDTLKLQGLKDTGEKIRELRDMIDVSFRYIRLMHINLLGYNAEIDSELSDAAYKSATSRHSKFFEAFQDSLKNDPPFFERLLHKYFSEGQDEQG
jgi:Arc/MetJ-type ribon-helix-helix transcriptional regulator